MNMLPLFASGFSWVGALLLLSGSDRRGERLNDPFPRIPSADVSSLAISASGTHVAFVADAESDQIDQLFAFPSDGSAAPIVVADEDANGGILSVFLTPDGTRALYTNSLQAKRTLYSVPTDGSSAPIDLIGLHVLDFVVTPDSQRLVFLGDFIADGRILLASMPVDGSAAPIVLNGPLTAGGDVLEFLLTADATRVIYLADANIDGLNELFSASTTAGGTALQLQATLSGREVTDFLVSPDGTRVVYRADQVNNDVFELFSVPSDGSSAPLLLNSPLPTTGDRDVEPDFVVSPDGTRVVYRADGTAGNVLQLYSVPIDGSAAPTLLTPTLVTGGDVESGLRLSPDAQRVLFRADLALDGAVELYSVPITGSAAPVRLHAPLTAGEAVLAELAIASANVAFVSDGIDGRELLSAALDGSAAAITLDSEPQFELSELTLGSNGLRVLYRKADATGSHLWSARMDGSSAALALSAGEDLGSWRVLPNGAGVLYVADEDVRSVAELYVRPVGGGAPALKLNPVFPDNAVAGSVLGYALAGERAVFLADPDESDLNGLYVVPLSGRRPPLEISATSGPRLHITGTIELGAGGSRAVFVAQVGGASAASRELFSAPLDGSSEPVRLSAPLQALGNVTAFRLSGDGNRVVYLADQETDEVFELYRAEVDGSGSPVKLSGTMVAGGDVQTGYQTEPRLDADGSHAFFVADRGTDNVLELWTADGILPPTKLNGALVPLGDVGLDFELSSDGAWIYYRADANVDGLTELFRVASDGSLAPVSISGPNLRGPGVQEKSFRLTPDGARVLFISYENSFGPPNAFTALTDASVPPERLNPTAGAVFGVRELELDPSGTTVVFHHDNKLYWALADGQGTNHLLTPTTGNQHVPEGAWAISPDGSRVVYEMFTVGIDEALRSVPIQGGLATLVGQGDPFLSLAGFDPSSSRVAYLTASSNHLFLAPVDGSSPPTELTSERTAAVTFSADSSTVLFRLNQRQSSYDLYASRLEKAPRPSGPPRPLR